MDWHPRFVQQASWTQEIRTFLLQKIGFSSDERSLEIGCGTGAILSELTEKYGIHNPSASHQNLTLFGLDIDFPSLLEARRGAPNSQLIQADALSLPLLGSSFRLVYCHFVLLWLSDPYLALKEMKRVAQPGGWVAAFAEPDYGGRLDYPDPLAELGAAQSASLLQQGADPYIGRKLRMLFSRLGFTSIETGILGARWTSTQDADALEIEWDVIEQDMQGRLMKSELSSLKEIDRKARECGERVLFVPTFYALGLVSADFSLPAPLL